MKTILCFSFVLFIVMGNCVVAQTLKKKPNVLFIIVDQLRYDALSIAGNTIVKTPNIDRIGRQGVYFKNNYTPMAVCAPARASIFTGRTVEHTGMLNNELAYHPLPGVMPQQTYDELLTANGYVAEYYGKYHSTPDHTAVYQNPEKLTSKGMPIIGPGMEQHFKDYLKKNVPVQPANTGDYLDVFSGRYYTPNPLDKHFNETPSTNKIYTQPDYHGRLNIPAEYTLTAMQAKETIDALERLKDKAFSLTCSFHFPHSPMLPAGKYYQMFAPKDMPVPVSIKDDMKNSPYKNANARLNNMEYADTAKIKYMISDYYGLVKEVDDWVGKILDKLDELKLANNTIIIFTADHGEMLGSHGLREKNVFYEESAHVPLMISYPKVIKANTVVDHYTSTIDLFATIFDYTGQGTPPSDGQSLRDLIEKKPSPRPNYVVTEWDFRGDVEPNYMIIKDGWKMFIPETATSPVLNALYNLKDDPFEINNLLGNNAGQAKYAGKVNELKGNLLEWLSKNGSKHINGVKDRIIVKN